MRRSDCMCCYLLWWWRWGDFVAVGPSSEQEQRAAKTTKAGNADKDEARSVGAESSSDSGKANSTAAALADKKAD